MGKEIRCPECGSDKFLAGPEGGASQDILCEECGTEYCYCGMINRFDKLERDEKRARIYGLSSLPKSNSGHLNVFNCRKIGLLTKIKMLFGAGV